MELKKLCITFIPWDIASNGPRESTLEREKKRKSLHKTFRRVMEGKLLFFLLFFSSLFSPSFFSCGSGVHWRKKKESLQDQREREGKKWLFSKTLAEEWRKLLLSPLESGRGNQCWRQRLFKKSWQAPLWRRRLALFPFFRRCQISTLVLNFGLAISQKYVSRGPCVIFRVERVHFLRWDSWKWQSYR